MEKVKIRPNWGTQLGRSKGGKATTKYFIEHPELARQCGFDIRKEINFPPKSEVLAEFIGIMLGDGSMSGNHQLRISFNYETDLSYAKYIGGLLAELFGVEHRIQLKKDSRGADIVVGGSNLIEFLLSHGLICGNKVKNQIDVPLWIKSNPEYTKACLRGLMDTDGGLYLHRYISSGKLYQYLKMCFTNESKPLLRFVQGTLEGIKCRSSLRGRHVTIHACSEISKYFALVGSKNPKNILKYNSYHSQRN